MATSTYNQLTSTYNGGLAGAYAGFTMTQYRAASAKLLGPFLTGVATSGSSTTILECTTSPYKSTLSQDDLYKDYYLMVPTATVGGDVSRIVDTYTAASGLFKPDQVYTNSPNGKTFELHGHPIEPYVALADMINSALKRTMIITEATFTPVTTNTRQLLLLPWLARPEWVSRAGYLLASETRDTVDPFLRHPIWGWVTIDGQALYLNHPNLLFDGTETVYLECVKPAYYHCTASGGLFGSQNGLTLETDQALPDAEWVASAVAIFAWDRYGHLLEQSANQKIIRDAAKAAAWFNELTEMNFVPPTPRLQRIRSYGPSRYGWGYSW